MKPYSSFSRIYDICMDNVPYDEWSAGLCGIMRKMNVPDGSIVTDLGCGTGEISRRLRDAGYDVIGIDVSEEMLMVAQDKEYERLDDLYGENEPGNEETGRITYLCQDIRSFELYGTTAAVVSVCDTLNYLLTEDELVKTFRLVNNYLERDGVFIFDMKAPRYYSRVLGDGVRVEDYETATLIWDNAYDENTGRNEYRITMFLRDDGKDNRAGCAEQTIVRNKSELPGNDGERYIRSDEIHVQRAYPLTEIRRLLEESGMVFVAAYDGYTENPADEQTERYVIVAREGFQTNKFYG